MATGQICALLIEDNPDDAALLQESLPEANGVLESIKIEWAPDLATGFKQLETSHFDIVLLDLSLPDSIHLDALKKLRAGFPQIPIVILTGLDDKAVAIEAVQNGAQDYLIKGKPSGESLYRCMRYAIERQSLKESIRRSASEARESQAKLELALTASQIGVYSWDILHNKISCDERVRAICGFEQDEISLEQLLPKVVQEDLRKVREALDACLNGKDAFETEFRVVWADETIHEVASMGQIINDNDGNPIRLTGVVRDITRQAEARKREQRLALLEQREEFIAMLAHDLRAPIHGTQRLLSNLLAGYAGQLSSTQSEALEKISVANQGMLHNINNILDVYRMEACPVTTTHHVEQGLTKIISACVAELEPIAESNDIALIWSPSDVGTVMVDGLAMGRVINNLISNALKFTPSGGRVNIRLISREGSAVIQVEDNGIGIDASSQKKIFQRFYQSEQKYSRTGLGLGLYLCKTFIERQNGSITCMSEPGKGSTFEISLPLVSEKESLVREPSAALNAIRI